MKPGYRKWTRAEERRLTNLVRSGQHTYHEIAKILGRSRNAVVVRAQQYLGLKNPTWLRRRTKHKHLRRRLLEYYQDHTAAECQSHFGLTPSEFKSCLTVAYRDPALSHIRKDHRRHDAWSFSETMMLLKHAGLRDRIWIAKRLDRGGVHAVKEMASRLNANTRYINGIPRRWVEALIGQPVDEGYKVKAGPKGRHDCRPIIVPWVVVYSLAKKSDRVPDHILGALRAMSLFQKRIHGTRGILDTLSSIEGVLRRHG